jgi:precorrin-2 dehydrogenase/sirohydrochlorin ferrochelatase
MEKNYYPVFLQLKNKLSLVVGGGAVAARKVASLLECAAVVRVVSPDISPELEELAQYGHIEVRRRSFEQADIEGASLVIAATNNGEVNRNIAYYCGERNIPVNVVDAPELSNFIVPATIRRGPLTIAVSTGGTMPAIARKIRQSLEGQFDEAYGQLLETLGEVRAQVLRDVPDPQRRKRIFTAFATEDLLSILNKDGHQALQKMIAEIIEGA